MNKGLEIEIGLLEKGFDPDTYIRERGAAGMQAVLDNRLPLIEFWATRYFGDTAPGASTRRFHDAVARPRGSRMPRVWVKSAVLAFSRLKSRKGSQFRGRMRPFAQMSSKFIPACW